MWLPAAANAFNILLVKRFFDNLPREVFEAAQDRRRGPVPAVLVDRAADVEADPRRRVGVRDHRRVEGLPLADARAARPGRAAAVGAPAGGAAQTELDVFLAALAISTLIPIVMFLLFQAVFLRSAGLGGAVKG